MSLSDSSACCNTTVFTCVIFLCIIPVYFAVYFPDRAVAEFHLMPQQAAILVTIVGATQILARPLMGIFGSKGKSTSAKQIIYATSFLISGANNCLSIYCNTMALQVVFVVIFGTISGEWLHATIILSSFICDTEL